MTDATIHPPYTTRAKAAPAMAPARTPAKTRAPSTPDSRRLSAETRDTLVVLAGSALMAASGVMLGCYLLLPFSGAY